MKNIIVSLSLALICSSSYASPRKPIFYTAEFKAVEVNALCPVRDDGFQCRAIGSKIKLQATLGCLDELIYSDFETSIGHGSVVVKASSIVKGDPKSIVALCNRANVVTKEVFVGFTPELDEIKVINVKVQTH